MLYEVITNDAGEHPQPMTMITAEDIREGRWKFNPALAELHLRGEHAPPAHLRNPPGAYRAPRNNFV